MLPEHDRQNFLSIWTTFCPFTPLTTQKIKIFKKGKITPGNITILHMCKMIHIWFTYMVPDIWSATDRTFCHFGPFFALLLP